MTGEFEADDTHVIKLWLDPPVPAVTATRADPMRQCFYRIGAMARMRSVVWTL